MSHSQFGNETGSAPAAVAESEDQPTNDPGAKLSEVEVVAVHPTNDTVTAVTSNSKDVIETGCQRRLSSYKITAIVDAARRPSVEKKLRDVFGPDAEIFCVEKLTTPESRAARLAEAEDYVSTAHGIVEELEAEMQEWADSVPENLQGSEKASEIQQAVDDLQALMGEIENLDFGSVYFPGMMG